MYTKFRLHYAVFWTGVLIPKDFSSVLYNTESDSNTIAYTPNLYEYFRL